MRLQVAVLGLYLTGVVFAAEPPCPTPKPLDCKQLKDLAARRHCEMDVVVMRGEPGPPGPEGKPGPPGPAVVMEARHMGDRPDCDPVPCIAEQEEYKLRPLLGFGLLYGEEHNLGGQFFAGLQFPPDRYGNNWQLQVGPTYMDHDRLTGLSRRVTTHGRSFDLPVNAPDPPGPWGVAVSAVVVLP